MCVVVTVTASSSITVQVPTVLTRAGEVPFRVDFSANGVSNDQSALFTISDRSNLIVSELIIDPSSDLFSGTAFSANTQISNVGGVSAGSTTVTFEFSKYGSGGPNHHAPHSQIKILCGLAASMSEDL